MDARDPAKAPMELLVSDLSSLGLTADVLVMISGGPDAKRQEDASTFGDRMWGPWTIAGPGTTDFSIMGQATAAWGPTPLVIATPPNWNGGDPLLGVAPNQTHYWHQQVRAAVQGRCAQVSSCRAVVTTQSDVPLDPVDDHPSAEGYGVLGLGVCHAMLEVL
jgi:hypothetical protein